ncbi:alpha/beta-hydrolase, partial [Hortaea werneckii]
KSGCTTVADECDAVVVSVGYRLAPEYPFPNAVEDGVDAIIWVHKYAAELGIDRDKIAISGFSSGGNMAFTVSLRLHDYMMEVSLKKSPSSGVNAESHLQGSGSTSLSRAEANPSSHVDFVDPLDPLGQIHSSPNADTTIDSHSTTPPGPFPIALRAVLAWYPSTDYTRTREQRRATCLRKGQELPSLFTDHFDESYLYPPDSVQLESPYLSPGVAPTALLKMGLPNDIIMLCCEWDMLLAEGLDFRDRLVSSEIDKRVSYTLIEGVPHGWDKTPNPFNEARDVRDWYLHSEGCGHTNLISNASLAGMSSPSKGGGGMPSSDFSGSEASGESFQPIGSLANRKLFTPGFRREPQESQEDQQVARTCPASPKKRKAESNIAVSIEEDALWQAIEKAVARALQAFIGPDVASGSLGDVRSRRREIKDIKDSIDKSQMQVLEIVNSAMAKTRTEVVTMLQGLTQMPNRAPTQDKGRDTVPSDADAQSDRVNQGLGAQNRQKSAPATNPSWAKVAGLGAPTATGWTIVTNGKRKLKKHPLEQRRILFARNGQSHSCDPRDIMFEVNRALAHARAHVTVRLIKMRYTEKGNLTGLLSETACAEDLLHYAPAVMAAVQKLDPEVMYMGKTEKWRKLRVHGVALDRYMGDGGLELVREEIELMMGEQLPYAPRWIKEDTLSERFHGGTVKRSTLVLTVKSKQTADTILAKGIS